MDIWSDRANNLKEYKGEKFYTITPIPLYSARRRYFFEVIENEILRQQVETVLDFGCGDGWYLKHLKINNSSVRYAGLEPAHGMRELAKVANPNINIFSSLDEVKENSVDLVFSVAVFAHIASNEIRMILDELYTKLSTGATFILIEQTSRVSQHGKNWYRRNDQEYIKLASDCRFRFQRGNKIAFPTFNFYEKYALPILKKLLMAILPENESRVFETINSISEILLRLPGNFLIRGLNSHLNGNTIFIFKKI